METKEGRQSDRLRKTEEYKNKIRRNIGLAMAKK